MLHKFNQDHALAFSCDGRGNLLELLHDARGFVQDGHPDILKLVKQDSRADFLQFLADVCAKGHALRKEIVLTRDGQEFTFSLFGLAKNSRCYLLAMQSPKQMFFIYEEFMAMINEQGRFLREEQKKSSQAKTRVCANDNGLLEDFMKLNNELANMQRELSIAHHELQIHEKQFRDLVTFNPDAQVVLDEQGRVLFFNHEAERIIGLSGGETIESVFSPNRLMQNEFCFKSGNGQTCVEVRRTRITWKREPATLYSLRDITERKLTEQIKDDVDRILHHDLISPLNPIVSLPPLLMDDPNITEAQRDMLDMISKAGVRMLNMVRMSLNLYKMEQGRYEFQPEPLDLVDTFRDIQADLSERARSKKVLVHLANNDNSTATQDNLRVLAEPNLCYSMFSNLILNAVEASPQGGQVTIRLSKRDRIHIAIHNRGSVPEEIRETFFEKYATKGKPHGTGLGTYSARLIAQTLGGDIRMDTSDKDGTTITVELPGQ